MRAPAVLFGQRRGAHAGIGFGEERFAQLLAMRLQFGNGYLLVLHMGGVLEFCQRVEVRLAAQQCVFDGGDGGLAALRLRNPALLRRRIRCNLDELVDGVIHLIPPFFSIGICLHFAAAYCQILPKGSASTKVETITLLQDAGAVSPAFSADWAVRQSRYASNRRRRLRGTSWTYSMASLSPSSRPRLSNAYGLLTGLKKSAANSQPILPKIPMPVMWCGTREAFAKCVGRGQVRESQVAFG